jgi:hypothetical protein
MAGQPATKRADQLKPGDRIWHQGDTYTVETSGPAHLSHWWHLDLGTQAGGVPASHVFTLVTK